MLRYVLDGELFEWLPGPGDVHPRPKPGSFMEYFTGKLTREEFLASFNEPPSEHPEWFQRDARLAGDGRAGRGGDLAVPVARRRARGTDAAARRRSGHRGLSRVQPVDRRRVGLRLPGPHLRGSVPQHVRPGPARRRVAVVPRPRSPHRRDPTRCRGHRRRPAVTGRPDVRRLLGAGPGVGHHRDVTRRRGPHLRRHVPAARPGLGRLRQPREPERRREHADDERAARCSARS